jgi:hypothetical protein
LHQKPFSYPLFQRTFSFHSATFSHKIRTMQQLVCTFRRLVVVRVCNRLQRRARRAASRRWQGPGPRPLGRRRRMERPLGGVCANMAEPSAPPSSASPRRGRTRRRPRLPPLRARAASAPPRRCSISRPPPLTTTCAFPISPYNQLSQLYYTETHTHHTQELYSPSQCIHIL